MAARVRIGTTGWSYDDWKRAGFYAPGTPKGGYLEAYGRFSDLVEVDSFYHDVEDPLKSPTLETVAKWALDTPPNFTFLPKAFGRITHKKKLREADELWGDYLNRMRPLRDAGKLGMVLLSLPPSFKADQLPVLDSFLGMFPSDVRAAVELRDRSWWRAETYRVLDSRGATLVWSETEYGRTGQTRKGEGGPVLTSDTAYVRIIGDQQSIHEPWDRLQFEKRPGAMETLRYWKERIEDEGRSAREVLVLLNNHFLGYGPATAAIMADVMGLPKMDLTAAHRKPAQRGLADF